MSEIVSGVLKSTVSILCSKLRDYAAGRLNEGDVNDEQCRQIIVRDLDDIKSKLDGLSRKDLLASISFFHEGVTRLYTSLETFGESACDGPSTSQASVEDQSEVEGATAMIPVQQDERDAIQRVFELSDLIGNLNVASQERYKSAKKSFEEAKRLATEAFNNAALSSEDRLMASKLRIASRILECLDDPEAAVQDCLLYLKELQDLPAVQTMFSVWLDSDKGITSRLRARFNQKKRIANMESVQMINELLVDIAMKFTNITMGHLEWPMIKIGKAKYLLFLAERVGMQVPWILELPTNIDFTGCALTSEREILSRSERKDSLEITRRNAECELFYTIPSENDGGILNEIRCFAVDEHDNVYIVIEIPSCYENVPTKYKLLTLDVSGNVKADRFLDIIEEPLNLSQMSVTKDGMIVIYCCRQETMYIYDSTNVRQDYKFPLPYKKVDTDDITNFSFTVSNKNEIICTFLKVTKPKFNMYIITMDGKLKCALRVPATISELGSSSSVVFDHVNETILVCLAEDKDASFYDGDDGDYDDGDYDDGGDDGDDDVDYVDGNDDYEIGHTTIYSFSDTGKLLHQFQILDWYPQLISHPNGLIALVDGCRASMLRI